MKNYLLISSNKEVGDNLATTLFSNLEEAKEAFNEELETYIEDRKIKNIKIGKKKIIENDKRQHFLEYLPDGEIEILEDDKGNKKEQVVIRSFKESYYDEDYEFALFLVELEYSTKKVFTVMI